MSHDFEAKQFLQDRGFKTHSLLMSFLPQRKIAFLAFCMLSRTLLGSTYLEVIFHW